MGDAKFIPSTLQTRASVSLEAEVAEELNIPDPTPAQAKAILEDEVDENPNRNYAGGED